jgi:hypothetical protein
MICFHDASLNKGRTNTKLIDRDFPHQVEMIGCSLESICYDLEGPFMSALVISGHLRRNKPCPLCTR